MLRDMYMKNIRETNKRKYQNVELGNYSCGSCRKCVVEYLMVEDLKDNKYDLNYITKCMEILNKFYKNQGRKTFEPNDYESILAKMVYNKPVETQILNRIKKS